MTLPASTRRPASSSAALGALAAGARRKARDGDARRSTARDLRPPAKTSPAGRTERTASRRHYVRPALRGRAQPQRPLPLRASRRRLVREREAIRFVSLGAPSEPELENILRTVVDRLLKRLRPRAEQTALEPPDPLGHAQAEALLFPGAKGAPIPPKRLTKYLESFSIHAGVHLHANDREGLERLLRYGTRPPLSLERLTALPDGRPGLSTQATATQWPSDPGSSRDRPAPPPGHPGPAAEAPPGPLPWRVRAQRCLETRSRAAATGPCSRQSRPATSKCSSAARRRPPEAPMGRATPPGLSHRRAGL